MHDSNEDSKEKVTYLDVIDQHISQLEDSFLDTKPFLTLLCDIDGTIKCVQNCTLGPGIFE